MIVKDESYTVRCTLADWLSSGDRIVESGRVDRVELTDREPLPLQNGCWRWWSNFVAFDQSVSIADIPSRIFDLLGGDYNYYRTSCLFHSKEEAIDALSRALIEYARSQIKPS